MKNVIFLMLLLVYSCQDSSKKLINNEYLTTTLIDSLDHDLKLAQADELSTSHAHPLYIGPLKDSINLTYSSIGITHKTENWELYRHVDSNDISIFIDTSRVVRNLKIMSFPPPPPPPPLPIDYNASKKEIEEKVVFDLPQRISYQSYPIFIKNNSKDTIKIGYGDYIPLIIEAQDSTKRWRPIQRIFRYDCGTGLQNTYLPNDNILVTSCKLFEGNYKTKMRVGYGYGPKKIYSNEYMGTMNYNQFNKPKY